MREQRQRLQIVSRLVAGDRGQYVVNVADDGAERLVEDIVFAVDGSCLDRAPQGPSRVESKRLKGHLLIRDDRLDAGRHAGSIHASAQSKRGTTAAPAGCGLVEELRATHETREPFRIVEGHERGAAI